MDIHESSWDSLPGAALELVWNSSSRAHPVSWIGLTPAPELPCFRLVCKAWLRVSRQCTKSLYAVIRSPDTVWPKAQTFPALQRLWLSVTAVPPGLKSLHGLSLLTSLQDLSVDTWGSVLPWANVQHVPSPDAIIQYVPFLTRLELLLPPSQEMEWCFFGRQTAPVCTELEGLTMLHRLCSLTLGSPGEKVPYHCLAQLPCLTSLKVRYPSEGLTLLSGLRHLHLFPDSVHWHFPKSFSVLSNLTFLEAGSTSGLCSNNLMSIKVFPKLQKLILNGPETGLPFADKSARRGKLEDALTTLDCISNLELREVIFTYNVFCQLATLTRLTCLRISSNMKHDNYQQLDQQLANLSSLTRLDYLSCWFRRPAERGPEIGSYEDCGNSLRAVMAPRPQVYFDIWFQPYRWQ